MLHSRTLLFISSIYNSLHLLIPTSQSSASLRPRGNHKSVKSVVLNSFFIRLLNSFLIRLLLGIPYP